MKRKTVRKGLCLLLLGCLLAGTAGCRKEASVKQVQAADLMEGIRPGDVSERAADEAFLRSQADFAVKLLQQCQNGSDNVLISPLSVMLALSMTANGAAGNTLAQMEALLAGEHTQQELNEMLYAYVKGLPSRKEARLQIANSIWFRDDAGRLTVEEDFLQTNADYYGASAYRAPFDAQTVKDINLWVQQETDGMIDEIVSEIPQETVMYLINALAFDALWEQEYKSDGISEDSFFAADGREEKVTMLHSTEGRYLENGAVTGFIKDYQGGAYRFAALLPNEGQTPQDYIRTLTGEELLGTLAGAKEEAVMATMPKFSCEYEISLNEALRALGISDAFSGSRADFSRMGSSTQGNLHIGDVLHKTYLEVTEKGTRAGAVTKVEMTDEAGAFTEHRVVLNRPFVYLILDGRTNLPIFIGTVETVR